MSGSDEVLSRFDTLIKIQALSAVAHLSKKKDKILFLNEAGLTPKEISAIVGNSTLRWCWHRLLVT